MLPDGYHFDVDPNVVGHAVLGKSTWAVLALTLDIELFTQLHYRQSIDPDTELSELFKDVFLYHWKEECQHAILDELEWVRHDAGLTAEKRDRAVDEFIELVAAVDAILRKPRPQPTQITSRRSAAAQSTRSRRGRSRPHSSRLTGGNTSIRAPSTRASARCFPA